MIFLLLSGAWFPTTAGPGKPDIRDGPIFVVNMRSVLANMNAPRGANFICFFGRRGNFLGKLSYLFSMPLWCEKGKLYLFGDRDIFDEYGPGNVIDLSDGYVNLKVYHEKKYGSSGGIADQ